MAHEPPLPPLMAKIMVKESFWETLPQVKLSLDDASGTSTKAKEKADSLHDAESTLYNTRALNIRYLLARTKLK